LARRQIDEVCREAVRVDLLIALYRYANGSPLAGRSLSGERQIVRKPPCVTRLPVDPHNPAELGP
jgi:hypothetical protein